MIAVFDIEKSRDLKGELITPSVNYSSGLVS